jgi:hypothetical protein
MAIKSVYRHDFTRDMKDKMEMEVFAGVL